MGADMVGYLVVGPAKISPSVRKRAIEEFVELHTSGFPRECEECGNPIPEQTGNYCETCGSDIYIYDNADEAKQVARRMIEQWPPDYRDVARRTSPDNRDNIIVFAGDMSWGDPPDGAGYRYLRTLVESGLARLIGVQ